MIGSEGIHNLSRAAGDESLQHPQRVNKDGHNEQDKGGRGRGGKKSADEEKRSRDSYERTAEEISAKSATMAVIPPTAAGPGQHASEKDLAQTADSPAGAGQTTGKTTEMSNSDNKTRNERDAAGAGTSGENNDHIDLIG